MIAWLPRLSLHMRRCLMAVMALLLSVQSATGAGVMPERAADGGVILTVCSAAGVAPATVTIDLGGAPSEQGKNTPCPHAMTIGGLPGYFAANFALPAIAPMAHVSLLHGGLSLGAASPLPPATGPPFLI